MIWPNVSDKEAWKSLQDYHGLDDGLPTQEKAHDYGTTGSIGDHLEDLHRYFHF
jgi:hypothetical protein